MEQNKKENVVGRCLPLIKKIKNKIKRDNILYERQLYRGDSLEDKIFKKGVPKNK